MDGGLLQKQSKQVINMTMGTRTEVSNKDAGEEGGGWGGGGAWEESCVGGGGEWGAETPKWKKKNARKKQENRKL